MPTAPDQPRPEPPALGALLAVRLGPRRLGIPLAEVAEVLRAAAVEEAIGDTPGVVGFLDLRGRTVPVIDLTDALGLPPRGRSVEPSDRFVIARRDERSVALVVDAVEGIAEASVTERIELPELPGIAYTRDAGAALGSVLLTVVSLDVVDPVSDVVDG